MKQFPLKSLKIFFLSFLVLFFTSCNHKTFYVTGSNDFHSLVSDLVSESAKKIKKNVSSEDIVLVSDFVNLDKLKNKSQLGFLLSDMLKDRLVFENIIVKEIELGKEFELGKTGFNLLTRNKDKIATNKLTKEKYAVVGTYSITSKSLNVFIKLIDIRTGYILSSSYERTDIDNEILHLEKNIQEDEKQNKQEVILRPQVVL